MTPRPRKDLSMQLDTLEKMSEAKNYNRWIFNLCSPHVGKKLLEVGAGIGNMTRELLPLAKVMATDLDANFLTILQQRFGKHRNLSLARWDLNQPVPRTIRMFSPDTVICVNILEHLEDDLAVLKKFNRLLASGGRCILYVPALSWLYGSWDKALHHYRRYQRKNLTALLHAAGFQVKTLRYVNAFGMLGWWWNSCVLRKQRFPQGQVTWFDQLAPWLERWEERVPPCLGQSLLAVGVKP
jgi:ubiquinone/menaquinone biosynthesis C-methylase UbiE